MDSISVVIPLYNKAPHIRRAIDSVLDQTKMPNEIIIIDDGSTDGGGDLVEQYKNKRIRLIRQKNKGLCATRNLGISLARGNLIAFLDADDKWAPGFLEVILNMRKIYPQAGVYATAYEVISPEGKKINLKFNVLPPNCKYGIIDNFFKVGIPQPIWIGAAAVPKNIFNRIGVFQGGMIAEDIDLWIRIGIYYPIVWNSSILSTYHMDATNRIFEVKKLIHEPAFSQTVREAIESGIVPAAKLQDLREYAAFWQNWAARQLILSENNYLASRIINQTRGTNNFRRMGWKLLILANFPPFVLKFIIEGYKYYFRVKDYLLHNNFCFNVFRLKDRI